jgi:hypothetical protein
MTGCHAVPGRIDTSRRVQPLDLAHLLGHR